MSIIIKVASLSTGKAARCKGKCNGKDNNKEHF